MDNKKSSEAGMNSDGKKAFGAKVTYVSKPKAEKPEVAEVEKVALYSSRNVSWDGVGKVKRGYNIMTKDKADKWLTRDHTRLATPEEVAKEFNI
jgi:hypothetical protein